MKFAIKLWHKKKINKKLQNFKIFLMDLHYKPATIVGPRAQKHTSYENN